MKLFHKLATLAIPAVCLGLSSCGNSFEREKKDMADIERDLAEQMIACENPNDVMELLPAIDEAAYKLDEMTANLSTNKADYIQEYKDLTLRELKELEKCSIESKKAANLMDDGCDHVRDIKDANHDEIAKKMEKYNESRSKHAKVMGEIIDEANK